MVVGDAVERQAAGQEGGHRHLVGGVQDGAAVATRLGGGANDGVRRDIGPDPAR